MEIVNIFFEETLVIQINNQLVTILPKKSPQHGDISFGINAPKSISVDREEVYHLKKRPQRVL
ncbi:MULTISPECIES: carbon storage regulator [Legionella]|uniref:Carbon storage regulator CsrA n=1 Tax=Legionella drozanskii LLAP-1 TaxID=1212489 RepID=A0A0W0SML9_9GAMM|nr:MULTISPECIES: carbon storage regulator [Legionella]KTC84429.1 carbon storage regulator CsrA [Legionella drozanskii LLAP-1]PJE05788.1 MAG: carbon storage regulator [Legionella sp.]